MPDSRGLSPKHQRFVAEYLKDHNATQAAIRAGYSEKTARQQGARLLSHASIAAAVAVKAEKQAAKLNLTAERVLGGLLSIAEQGEVESNRVSSWGLLGKHLKLFVDKQEVTGADGGPLVVKVVTIGEDD